MILHRYENMSLYEEKTDTFDTENEVEEEVENSSDASFKSAFEKVD